MKVSVIIPTYNRAHFIHFAIDSVLRQTFSDLEILVIDDGSTDGTAELLHSQYGDKIRYIYQENRGFGAARNRGVEAASGKYIAFLDSDDLWHEGKLELQVSIMDDLPDLAFLFSDFSIMKETGKLIHSGLGSWFTEPREWENIFDRKIPFSFPELSSNHPGQDFLYIGNLYHHLLTDPYILPSTAIVRSDKIDPGVQHTEGDPICADWNFFALLSRNNQQASFMPIETAINRSHDDPVRATRCVKKSEKLKYRLSAVEQIWKADPDFLKIHAEKINKLESRLLLQLAKQLYLQSHNRQARKCLDKWKKKKVSEGRSMVWLLHLLTRMPGSSKLLSMVR